MNLIDVENWKNEQITEKVKELRQQGYQVFYILVSDSMENFIKNSRQHLGYKK